MKECYKPKALGELAKIVGGGTPSKRKPEYYTGSIPWATVRDMRNDFLGDTECSITETAVRESSTNVIPAGNVVIATRVGLGKVCIITNDTAINQDLRGVIPISCESLSPDYLFYWFKSIASKIISAGTGATVQGVKLNFVKSLRIPLPPLPEQKRIVEILDEAFEAIDKAIANTERNIKNAREVFESHLNEVFSRKGEGWVERRLSELCDIKHGFAFKGEFFTSKGEYVVLTPGNYYESGGYRDRGEKQKYYAGEIPADYILKAGDMLVAMTEQAAGLLGSPLIVPESDKFLHNQRLGLVTAKPGVPWTNEFFFHIFNLQTVRQAICNSASGVKVRHTSPTKIGEVVVSFPTCIKEQKDIVVILANLHEETQRLAAIFEHKLAALVELKKSLLNQAFAWEL